MKHVVKFYGHLFYFTAIWYILWSFGYIFQFWYVVTEKSGNPDRNLKKCCLAIHGTIVNRCASANDQAEQKSPFITKTNETPFSKAICQSTPGLPDGLFPNQKSQI
jgi:hypothetical protein